MGHVGTPVLTQLPITADATLNEYKRMFAAQAGTSRCPEGAACKGQATT